MGISILCLKDFKQYLEDTFVSCSDWELNDDGIQTRELNKLEKWVRVNDLEHFCKDKGLDCIHIKTLLNNIKE